MTLERHGYCKIQYRTVHGIEPRVRGRDMTSIATQSTSKGVWKVAHLLILFLAFAQIAIVAHSVEHSVAYPDKSCSICAQLDRLGDACLPDFSVLSPAPNFHHNSSHRPRAKCGLVTVPYQARASP